MRLDNIDVKVVRDRVRISEKYRDEKFITARRPDKMLKWYRGEHYVAGMPPAGINAKDQMVVNFSLVNAIIKVATLGYGPPVLHTRPKSRAAASYANKEKRLLEYRWREIQATKATRRALLDCKVVGTGVCATGWRYLTETREYEEKPEAPGIVQKVVNVLRGDDSKRTLRELVVADHPVVRHVLPTNILLDPDSPAEDIQRGWWIAEKVTKPLRMMREDPKYRHIAHKLEGKTEYRTGWAPSLHDGASDEHLRAVTYYVVYLRDRGCRIEWTEELADDVLWVGDELGTHYPADENGRVYFPYVLLRNYPDLDSHYAISDIELTETQQASVDIGRSMLARHRRTSSTLYGYDKNVVQRRQLEAVRRGDPNALIPVDVKAGDKGKDLIWPLDRQPIQPEVYSTLDFDKLDFSELPGITAFMRAQGLPTERRATEVMQIAEGAQARLAFERQDYEMFVAELAQQLSRLEHRWGTEAVEVPQGAPNPEQEQFEDIAGTEIEGAYSYLVEPASMDPPQSQIEEQKWQARLIVLLPLVEQGLNIKPIVEQYLNSFDFGDVDLVLRGMMETLEAAGAPQEDIASVLGGALGGAMG